MNRRRSSIICALFFLALFQFSAERTFSAELEKGMVSITFDDGDISLDQYAKSILVALNIPATAYIIPGSIGQPYAVSWKNLWDLQQNHGWEIGNHTQRHLSLPSLTNAKIKSEVLTAQNNLLNQGLIGSGAFAPPFGEYDDRVLSVLKGLNVITSSRQAWTINGDFLNKPATFNRWELKVVGLSNAPTFEDMEYVLDQAVQQKGWVIFVFHGVWPIPEVEYEMTPELLQQMAEYANSLREQGTLDIVTANEGLRRMLRQKSLP